MSRYAKTIVAAVPFIIAALKVISDGLGDGVVSTQEWLSAAIAALGAVAVYAVPNRPPAGELADPNISEQDVPVVSALSHLDDDEQPGKYIG